MSTSGSPPSGTGAVEVLGERHTYWKAVNQRREAEATRLWGTHEQKRVSSSFSTFLSGDAKASLTAPHPSDQAPRGVVSCATAELITPELA